MDNREAPHATTVHGCATSHLALLKSVVMKCAIASAPAKSLSLQQLNFIEKRIQEFAATVDRTPDHPPYASMIGNAIKHLNEEGGSNEEAISKFILEEYKDLPWAHTALLNHHLKRLSESGILTESHDGCYLIGIPSIISGRAPKASPMITRTTSPRPSPSPRLTPCPSTSSSSSSSTTYASSDTASSDQSYNLKRGRKKMKRNCKGKKSQQHKQRGIKIHPKVCARGRGRGRGCRGQDMMKEVYIGEVADDISMNGMQTVEIICLLSEDEAANENIQGKKLTQEQANQDDFNEDMMKEVYIGEVADDISMHGMQTVEIICLLSEDEAADENIQGKELTQEQSNQDDFNEDMMKEVYIGEVADDMQTVEIICLLSEDEVADENIQGKELTQEQANQDYVELGSKEQQIMVMDVESPEHEYRIDGARIEPLQRNTGDDCSALGTIPSSSRRRKLTGGQGSKKVRQQKRNIPSRHTPQTGMGRGRSRKRETGNKMNQLEATEIKAVKVVNDRKTWEQSQLNEHQCYLGVEAYLMNDDYMHVNRVECEEEDSMDELIDEVCAELTGETKTIYDDLSEGNLERKEPHEVEKNQEVVNVELGTYNNGVTVDDYELSQHLKQVTLLEPQRRKSQDFPRLDQYPKLQAGPSRNKSTNTADGSGSSTARPELRRRN